MLDRERALAGLLHVRNAGSELYRAAIEVVVAGHRPLLAGLALIEDQGADPHVHHAWFDGSFVDGFVWDIEPALFREIVGSGSSTYRNSLSAEKLPGRHLLRDLEEADFLSELVRCGEEIRGFLFWVEQQGQSEAGAAPGALGHLAALRISCELENETERSARRRTQQQIADVEAMASDWFWEMDAGLRISYLSEGWLQLTGQDPECFLGKTLQELGAEPLKKRWKATFEDLSARRPICGFRSRTVGADGRVRYWRLNGWPSFDETGTFLGYRGTGIDVTAEVVECRRAEKAERLLQEAIEAITQGLVLFDENDALVISNRAYKELHPEIASDLVPGADFVDLTRLWSQRTGDRENGVSAEELFRRRIRAHRSKHRTFEYTRADGRTVLVNEQKTEHGSTVWLHTDVTTLKQRASELKALGDALAVKNHQMDTTINAITDAVVMYDADDRLVLWNRRFQELFAFGEDQLHEGMSSKEILTHVCQEGLLPGLEQDLVQKWQDVRDRGEVNYKRRLAGGRVLGVTGVRMADTGIIFTFRDLTLSEEQEQALRDSSQQLQALNHILTAQNAYFEATLNSMVQGLATFDPQDRLMVCNRRFQEIFQLPEHLAREGMDLTRIAQHVEQSGLLENAFERITKTHAEARASGFEVRRMRLADGRAFELRSNRLDNDDLLITFNDITELERRSRDLKSYAEQLEVSNHELQEFAYVASHDLQEPLRKIEAFGDRLRRKCGDALGETGTDYLDRMQSASGRMRTLITNLLDYSRIATSDKPFREVDLGQLVDAVAGDLEIALETSEGEIRHSDLPTIEADATQMRQLFQNLISNALKFRKDTEPPVVEVSAKLLTSSGEAVGASEQVEISVTDNGIGFEETQAEQVFKIFQRLHSRNEYEGTGIGLATCRKIVDRHGGTISASSRPGAGTTIKFTLPTSQNEDEEHEYV